MFRKERHKTDGYFIDVRRAGTGNRPLILIHGIGVSGNYFLPLAERMSEEYDVHLLDMPGYGDTPKPDHPLTPREQAAVIARYVQAMNLNEVAVLGQSMGCQTAAHFAADYPHLCEKLLLIGPTVNKWERRLHLQAFRLFLDTFREPFAVNAIILHDYFHMGVRAYLITSRHMIEDEIEKTLPRVTAPICIIRGGRDGISPKRWVEYLGGIGRGTQTHHVKNAPHNVQYSHAKEVATICQAFLEK